MLADHTYFLTATIFEWKQLLKPDKYKDILIKEWKHRVQLGHLKVYGFVVMPNHYHILLRTLTPNKPQDIQRDVHKWVSRQIFTDLKANHPKVLAQFKVQSTDRQYQLWQRHSLAVEIFSESVLMQKLNYIHMNPVQPKWSLVEHPNDYYYSSSKQYNTNEVIWDFVTNWRDG